MTKGINSPADINVSRILRLIWQHKGISRIEIAAELGIDKSTVTKITATLVEMGLICETAHGTTGPLGGRKPIFLEINGNYAGVGGIEINPERFVCCLLDLHGVVLFQQQEQISPELYKKLGCTGIFFKAFDLIIAEAEKRNISLAGIGVGIPGIVDTEKGVIIQSVSLLLDEPYPFLEEISARVNVPVYLENDARCGCYSEKMLINDASMQNMLFVLAEFRVIQPKIASEKNLSVGMGLIINGQMYKGSEGSAGEFRSLLWDGAADQFSSRKDLLSDIHGAAMDSIFFELACHIAFLVNILNLEVVYIGGLDTVSAHRLLELVTQRIKYQWPYCRSRNYVVRIASLGMFTVSYGAASMVIEDLFSLPSLSSPSGNSPSILESFAGLKTHHFYSK